MRVYVSFVLISLPLPPTHQAPAEQLTVVFKAIENNYKTFKLTNVDCKLAITPSTSLILSHSHTHARSHTYMSQPCPAPAWPSQPAGPQASTMLKIKVLVISLAITMGSFFTKIHRNPTHARFYFHF